ncbi:hypothetical protein ABZ590_25110 [Streptomyces hirsutus]|uniref:hypothetical protein n=1 Tax=Streptomyces hirsutus TaxID=35620 RepID=UPI0033D59946
MNEEGLAYVRKVKEVLGSGYIGENSANRVIGELPDISTRIDALLSDACADGDWQTVTTLANLARWVAPTGLTERLIPILEARPRGVNKEDLVEILGELESESAVPVIARVFEEELDGDAPGYWLCKKCIAALGAVHFALQGARTSDAADFLRQVATGDYPNQLKWEAAVELGIEDDLGFDEDEMTA